MTIGLCLVNCVVRETNNTNEQARMNEITEIYHCQYTPTNFPVAFHGHNGPLTGHNYWHRVGGSPGKEWSVHEVIFGLISIGYR